MSKLLEEMLEFQNRRWAELRPIQIDELLTEFSVSLAEFDSDALLDLVCNEARLRIASGVTASLQEYQQRFPHIGKELATQWQVNSIFEPDVAGQQTHHESIHDSDSERYEVFQELGRGGMGIVYEAYDRRLARVVALKRLRAEFGQESLEFMRFQREAESIGQLNHPNLVHIYDYGMDEQSPFIVMEYCGGRTLAERLAEPMTAVEAVQMMLAVTSAVSAAHRAGIIHRDLKPANILIALDEIGLPTYKVSDFGLAKSLEISDSNTLSGSILGSPAYMSPEQASGDVAALTPATDVYALGAMLFQCLTSRPPFVGDTIADVLHQVRHDDPLQVRSLNPRTPKPLETIVAKCLSKSPNARYVDATELHADLLRFRSGQAIFAKPERVDQRLSRIVRRNRLPAALIALSFLLLLGIVVSSSIYSFRLSKALVESDLLTKAAVSAADQANQSARLTLLEKAQGLLGKAIGQRVSKQPGRRLVAQNTLREAIQIGKELNQPESWFAPYRDELLETMWLSDLCVPSWKRLRGEIAQADFSPSGTRACVVYRDGSYELFEWDSENLQASGRLKEPAYVAFLDENRFLAFDSDSVTSYRLSKDRVQSDWELQHSGGFANYWLDRQRDWAMVYTQDRLLLIDLSSGKISSSVANGEFTNSIEIAFHPKSNIYLITGYSSGIAEVRDLVDHRVLFRHKSTRGFNGATGAVWSHDGQGFALVDGDTGKVTKFLWDSVKQQATIVSEIDTGKTMPGPPPGIGGGVRMVWGDDDLLLTRSWSNQWSIHDSEFSRTYVRTPGLMPYTNFSNIPNRLGQGEHRVALVGSLLQNSRDAGALHVALGGEQKLLVGQQVSPRYQLVVSKDGSFAVYLLHGAMKFIDLSNGRNLGGVKLSGLNTGAIAMDGENRLYLCSPDCAIVFQLEITRDQILIKDAHRFPVPNTSLCPNVSSDGSIWTCGAWAGYHSASYAGCWIKTAGEPTVRKILHMQSGEVSSIDPQGRIAVVYSGGQIHRVELPSLSTTLVDWSTLEQPVQFSSNGQSVIAAGKVWSTSDWTQKSTLFGTTEDISAMAYSKDGSQLISKRRDYTSQLRNAVTGEIHLQSEADIVYYDSQHGVLLCSASDGLYFRDLKSASQQLVVFGINWNGPVYEQRKPLEIQNVVLAPKLAKLQSYDAWMDYLNEQTLQRAELEREDGHRQFEAAMVQIERCQFEDALSLLNQCHQRLPQATTPLQWQAYVLAALERWDEAILYATKFIEATDDTEMRLSRAEWNLKLGQIPQAIEDAEVVGQQNVLLKRRALAIKLLAYEHLGDASMASKIQELIEEHRPPDKKYADTVGALVSAEISIRLSQIAKVYARQIREPENPEYVVSLAWMHVRNGEFSQALNLIAASEFDESKQERFGQSELPEYASVLALRVICHAKLANHALAQPCLEELRRLQPTSCDGDWFMYARETRMLIAEAERVMKLTAAKVNANPE